MLRNIIASLILASSLASAQNFENERFQLLAQNIETKENITTALGKVVIYSKSYYLSADKILYDKKSETIELFGNVFIIKDNRIQTQSEYAYINLKNDSYKQEPVMLFENKENLWINSKSSKKEDTIIDLENSIISSCDCVDPFWSIRVSSASYDTKDQWLHTFNPRLYFKNVPVFYAPYFGFSTNKNRRTGLLIPTIGYSKNEHLYYSQPFYYAPSADIDLEIVPQLRTRRGYGVYSYLRWADSQYSTLKLKAGFFEEKDKYAKDFNLTSKKHYGWDINYERRKLFSDKNSQDGLYASITWLNDIEYKTLEQEEEPISTDKKVESKINYFYNTPKYYTGLYGRYYIDTESGANKKETLQELPQLQFHSYNKEILFNRLLYSADAKYINYHRREGLNADIYQLSLPLTYSKHFLDDFMYINLENRVNVSKYKYSNSPRNFKDGTLLQNEVSVTVGTDLIKPYKDYLHTINIDAKYSHPKNIKKNGDLYGITNNDNDLASFPITQGNKNINISLNQSLYDNKSLNQVINHKLSQSILYEGNSAKLQNLDNYVKVNYDNGYISNKLIYNVKDKQFTENNIDVRYKYEDFDLKLGYYKSKDTPNSGKEDLESFRIDTSYQIAKDYKVSYYENYNLRDNLRNKQAISLNVDDICWNLDLKYEKEVIPATSNDEGVDQKILYMKLELKPLGGVKQKYKVEDNN